MLFRKEHCQRIRIMTKRFIYHPGLYLGEGIEERKLDKIKKRLEKKPLFANVYLIVPARNPVDQLEYFDARQLIQPYYQDASFLVLGIAASQGEANELVERMVQDCLKERGDCKLREYFQC